MFHKIWIKLVGAILNKDVILYFLVCKNNNKYNQVIKKNLASTV